MIYNKLLYYFFSLSSRTLSNLELIDKNHFLFQKKRVFLLKILPDEKLISEIAGVAHTLYHPYKNKQYIKSIRDYLEKLLAESKKRGISGKIIRWAQKMFESPYNFNYSSKSVKWTPDLVKLKTIYKFFKNRKTNRYSSKNKIDMKLVKMLLNCAIEAPSSCNKQPWRFLEVYDKKKIKKISELKKQVFIKDFPCVIVCCFEKDAYIGTDIDMTPYLDCGAAIMNMCNAASAVGFAACWCNFTLKNIGKKRYSMLANLLQIDKKFIPVSLLCLGIPLINSEKPPRETLDYYSLLEKKKE